MNEVVKTQKLKRFIADPNTSEAVYEVILDEFLKTKKETDVQFLAAQRIAIDLLQSAWREIEKYKDISLEPKEPKAQVGV